MGLPSLSESAFAGPERLKIEESCQVNRNANSPKIAYYTPNTARWDRISLLRA
jgi:hypothetical protein